MSKTNHDLRSIPIPCDPCLVPVDVARQMLGYISENHLKTLLHELGIKSVRLGRVVVYHIDDIRQAARIARERSYTEEPD